MRHVPRNAAHYSPAVLLAVLALAGAPARGAAQSGCLQELKMPTPGEWAEYEGKIENEQVTMRYARLDKKAEDTASAWVEMSINKGKNEKDRVVYQALVSQFPFKLEQVEELVFKAGKSDAIKPGAVMMRSISGGMQKSGGLKIADLCNDVSLVGNERETVPGGIFSTRHYTNKDKSVNEQQKFDTWVAGGVPFGLVKATGWRYEMVLQRFGKDAKSHITETPKETP